MARFARIVASGLPHHVTQRVAGRQRAFDSPADYASYIAMLREQCDEAGAMVLAYCILPTVVHLIVVPRGADGLRRALATANKRHARRVNGRRGKRGKLWHGRFASFPLDDAAVTASARYIELAPVRAGLAATTKGWKWSSASAHIAGRNDALVNVRPLLSTIRGWSAFLAAGTPPHELKAVEAHIRTGRPMGTPRFIAILETKLGRVLAKQKPGPKPGKPSKRKKKRGDT